MASRQAFNLIRLVTGEPFYHYDLCDAHIIMHLRGAIWPGGVSGPHKIVTNAYTCRE